MSNASLQDIKEKFSTVQNISQSLKEEKIRTESELKTLKADYDELVKELLEKTGTTTVEEAIAFYQSQRSNLDSRMVELSTELSKYLDTYGEDENE